MTLETVIGPTIRGLRISQGLQGKQLAKAVPMSTSYLSEIEHGHQIPSIALLGDIASGLGMGTADLWLEIYNVLKED